MLVHCNPLLSGTYLLGQFPVILIQIPINSSSDQYRMDFSVGTASILRTNYDVMLQGLYIMIDPKQRTQRAKLYLDFMHIERQQRIDLVDRNDTDVARHISNSPTGRNFSLDKEAIR